MWWLWSFNSVSVLSCLTYILFSLPPEDSQGYVQKIFFLHVPSAFAMYTALILGTLASIIYLIERKEIYDLWAKALMLVSLFFSFCVMTSGPIWAKPIWGVYWTWDPRLTASLLITLLLVGYHATRYIFSRQSHRQSQGRIICAILAILATLDIPLIHYSVKLWRGIHPSIAKTSGGLPPSYLLAFEWMSLNFILLAILLSWFFAKQFILEAKWKERGVNPI